MFIKQQNHKATYKAEPTEIFRFLINSSQFPVDTSHCDQIIKQVIRDKRVPNLADADIEMILRNQNKLVENISLIKKR